MKYIPALAKAIDKRPKNISQMHGEIQKMIGNIRIKRANAFEQQLQYFLESKYLFTSLATSHNRNHGIYNYDIILALQGLLVEGLVFTDNGLIELLPALPPSLKTGEVRGVKGRNRTTIRRLQWDIPNRRIELEIVSDIDQSLTLIHRAGIKQLTARASANEQPGPLGGHARILTSKAGETTPLSIEW